MTVNDRSQILNILSVNLSEESKWFLWTLIQEKRELHKEELRDMANHSFLERTKQQGSEEIKLVTSRHGLDIHTARLEGAGLVVVRSLGRVRLYSVTPLGTELFEYITNRNTNPQ